MRTKIEVSYSVLGVHGSRPLHVVVGATTTSAEVILKVLEKTKIREPPIKYQLWAVARDNLSVRDKPLRDDDHPSEIATAGGGGKVRFTFQLRLRSSCLVRVYYSLEVGGGDQASFQSLIVSPAMSAAEVLKLAVGRVSSSEDPRHYHLVLKTATGERIVAEDEVPFLLHGKTSKFELKKKAPKKKPVEATPTATPTSHPTHPLTPDSGRPASAMATFSSSDQVFDYSSIVSAVEMNRGKLQLHSQLIEALRQFAGSRATGSATDEAAPPPRGGAGMKTREKVLEQALVEQNQILDIMQELVSTLETENKFSREKINSQAMTIHNLSSKSEVASIPPLSSSSSLISARATRREPQEVRSKEVQRPAEERASSTLLSATRAKLEAERIKVIELEEDLSSRRDEINKLRNAFSEKRTVIISKESEILHLRHEMDSLKKFGSQQQDTVMKLRTALMDKEIQLTSLTRALSKEKKITEQIRRRQVHHTSSSIPSPEVADSSSPASHSSVPQLFEQVIGREIHAVELTRVDRESELGFSFAKMDLPVSSRVPCLIVKAVHDTGAAYGLLKPGDEILEVCGLSCRSTDQQKALECLEQTVGVLRLVVARDQEDSRGIVAGQYHSTPISKKGNSTTLWATALSQLTSLSEPSSPEYVTVPEPQDEEDEEGKASSEKKDDSKPEEDSEESYEEGETNAEVAELQEQLDESEQLRYELNEELEAARGELDNLQMEFDLTKAENFELQQQVATHDQEMTEIRKHIQELQAALVKLEDQITNDHETIGSLENRNRLISQELFESQAKTLATRKECSEAQTELTKLRDLLHEKEKLASQSEEESVLLRDTNDQLKSDGLKKEQQIASLKSQLDTVKAQHDKLLQEEREQTEKIKLELQAVNETSIKTASTAQDEHEQLRVQLNSAKSVLMEAEMKESTLMVEMRYLKQAADVANKQLAEKEDYLKQLSDEMSEYKHIAETKTLELETLTIGLRAAQSKIDTKTEMISRLQNDIDGLRRSNAKLQTERSQLGAVRKNLESKLKVTASELEHLKEKLISSNSEKDDLFQKLEESISESMTLQHQVEDLSTKLAEADYGKKREGELQSKLNELMAAKTSIEEEASKKVEMLKVEKSILEDELTRVRSDVAAVRETSQSSSGELERLGKELAAQRETLLSSESERVNLAHSCKSLKKKEVRNLEEIQLLKSDKERLEETVQKLQLEQSSAQAEMEVLQKKSEGSGQQLAKLKEDLKALETTSEQTRREVQEQRIEMDSSKKTIGEQKLEIQDLEAQLNLLSSELEEKNQEVEDLQTNFKAVSTQLAAERQRESEARSAHADLESKLTQLRAAKKQSDDMVASLEFMQGQNQAKIEELTKSLSAKTESLRKLGEAVSEDQQQLHRSRTQSMRLTGNVDSLRKKLKAREREAAAEMASLKEKLSTSEGELQSLKEELESCKETNSKQSATILQWKKSLEHANDERYKLQKSVDDFSRQKLQAEARSGELETQLTNSQEEIQHLKSSNDTLSSETARLRQQLKETGRATDEMSAKFLAVEMNLAVAKKSLEEGEQQHTEWTQKVAHCEAQLEEANTRLDLSLSKLEQVTLELHGKDEQISKLKAALDLRQKESSQLQQSLLTVQGSATVFEKRTQVLETEKKDLMATVEQLKECQDTLRSSLLELEAEKESAIEKWKTTAEDLKTEAERLELKGKEQCEEIGKVERAWKESQDTVEQLLAAQDALKQSIHTLGDEKEVEVLRLGEKVMQLEGQLMTAQKELSKAKTAEVELQESVAKLNQEIKVHSDRCQLLKDDNLSLKHEVEVSRDTEHKLTDLHSKLTMLEEGLRNKNAKLEELERTSQLAASKLQQTQEENENLLTEIAELASLKLSQAEQSAEIDRLNRDLSSQAKTISELSEERDQLLTMLRKLEVEKHTTVVQQPTPKLGRGEERDPAKMVALLKDKEEEAQRLREYVGKLLSSVVEKAPFVLENMQ